MVQSVPLRLSENTTLREGLYLCPSLTISAHAGAEVRCGAALRGESAALPRAVALQTTHARQAQEAAQEVPAVSAGAVRLCSSTLLLFIFISNFILPHEEIPAIMASCCCSNIRVRDCTFDQLHAYSVSRLKFRASAAVRLTQSLFCPFTAFELPIQSQLAVALTVVLHLSSSVEGLTAKTHLQNVRKPSSWMDAAVNVTEHSRLYNALFYNFQGLKWAAQNYAQAHTGGGYGRAGESVRKTTQKVSSDPRSGVSM